jgi:hypothetical protein
MPSTIARHDEYLFPEDCFGEIYFSVVPQTFFANGQGAWRIFRENFA